MAASATTEMIALQPTARILIVSLRYFGDVLVTTPLARSLRCHFPQATIDYLVFAGTEGALANNPDIDAVRTMPRGSRSLRQALELLRSYDVAIATNPSDRMTIWACLAGKRTIGLTLGEPKEWWKRYLLAAMQEYDDRLHVVPMLLRLLQPLNVPAVPEVVVGQGEAERAFARERLPAGDYVLLHPYSRGSYKYWPPAAWGELAQRIATETGCVPVFTVTPDPADRELLASILATAPAATRVLPEVFSLPQLAAAIGQARAYIGIDTAVTHVAAACGVPTLALFGPTKTRYWAPWPNGCRETSPFAAERGVQRVGNVTVVQQDWSCVPCNRESCAISERGRIECLEQLSVAQVFAELCRSLEAPR